MQSELITIYIDHWFYRDDYILPMVIKPNKKEVVTATIKRALGRKREQESDPARWQYK